MIYQFREKIRFFDVPIVIATKYRSFDVFSKTMTTLSIKIIYIMNINYIIIFMIYDVKEVRIR